MKTLNRISLFVSIVLVSLGIGSCADPSGPCYDCGPYNELITHVQLTLKDSANMQDSVVARFSDPDGPSGTVQPVITGVTLAKGRTYYGSVRFLKVDNDRMTEVTDEVRELSTQHQVFYLPENMLQLVMSIKVTDKDANGLPLGLETVVRTNGGGGGSPISGKVNVVLSHFEQLGTKNGVTRSDESDVDIDFPITIE